MPGGTNWGVGIITMYLTLTAGLKVTTPALFRLVLANQTVSFAANSTLSSPFLHASLWKRDVLSGGSEYVSDPDLISSATFLTNILMDTGDGPNEFGLGLQDNILYDVVAANTGSGTTTVNTHTMNVTCGTSSMSRRYKSQIDGRLYWVYSESGYDGLTEMAPNVLRILPRVDAFHSSKLEVYGSFNVSDTSGKVASQIFLDPPMNPLLNVEVEVPAPSDRNITAMPNFNVSSMSYIRCSLAIINSSLPLDTSSRSLLRRGAPRKATSSWPFPDNVYQNFAGGGTESLWAFSLSTSETTASLSSSPFCVNMDIIPVVYDIESYPAPCTYLTKAESALMHKLSLHPPASNSSWSFGLFSYLSHENVPVTNVMLHDLENALEDYAATFYWSLAYLRKSPTIQEIEVTGSDLVSQLQLDILPVVAGTIFSIALLLLSPILVGFRPTADKRKNNIDFDTLGVLETVWLAGSESAVTAVKIPSTKHLRKAGTLVETSGCKWRREDHPLRRRSSSFS